MARAFDSRKTILISGPDGPGLLVGRALNAPADSLAFMPAGRPGAGFMLSRAAISHLRGFLIDLEEVAGA